MRTLIGTRAMMLPMTSTLAQPVEPVEPADFPAPSLRERHALSLFALLAAAALIRIAQPVGSACSWAS